MESIFIDELNIDSQKLEVLKDEAKHLKVLRIKDDEEILITNGKSLAAIATVKRTNKNDFVATVKQVIPNFGELDFSVSLAIGILDSQSRFEFAIEKCIELGVSEIFPLILDFSQQKKINHERLVAKSIATIKQCKRSKLPIIHFPQTVKELLEKISVSSEKYQIILTDENGENPSNIFNLTNCHCGLDPQSPQDTVELYQGIPHQVRNDSEAVQNTIIFVGCEGGFSENELLLFPQNTVKWNLGNRRLRAETAAIISMGIITIKN
jgi:16S rRNA (uracil1498-N3)-methyltransferase